MQKLSEDLIGTPNIFQIEEFYKLSFSQPLDSLAGEESNEVILCVREEINCSILSGVSCDVVYEVEIDVETDRGGVNGRK